MVPLISDPIDTSHFDDLSVNDLIVETRHLADKADTHVAFQGELSEYVSKGDELRLAADHLEKVRDLAAGGDKDRGAELKAQVAAVKQMLIFNAHHITMLSLHRKDPSILSNSGYNFKQKPASRPKVNLLDLVPDVFVKHVGVTGVISVLVKRAKKLASIELQITDKDPLIEAEWRNHGEGTYTKSRIEIRELQPATKVYIRARYHEEGKAGAWSTPVSLIVL